jgi:hypothetical protein
VLEGGIQLFAHVVARHVDLDAPGGEASCSVAKLALPMTRLSIMRPATLAVMGGFQRLCVLSPCCGLQVGGVVAGLEVVGEGHALPPWAWASRRALELSRGARR